MQNICLKMTRKPMNGLCQRDDNRSKQTMLYSKRVAISRNKLYPYRCRSVRDARRILLFLISQFIENDIISIEMDPCM